MRKRAALLTQVPQPNSQDHVPEIGQKLTEQANRAGIAARFPAPAVQKRVAGDLALMAYYARLLRDLALTLLQTAKQHDAQRLSRRQSVPGIGKILSWVWLYEMHDITRVPRGQDVVAYCRLVTGAQASAGHRSGTSGAQIGNASLQWACSEAAVLLLRHNPLGQKYLARLEHTHGKGNALPIVAHTLARAVYDLLQRETGVDMPKCLHGSWSGAGEPHATLDTHGHSLGCGALLRKRRQSTRRSTEAREPRALGL